VSHYEISGTILDIHAKPAENILVIVHEYTITDVFDQVVNSDTTDKNGYYKISFNSLLKPHIYLVISDPNKNFKSVKFSKQADFERKVDSSGRVTWKSEQLDLDKLENVNIVIQVIPDRKIPEKYDAVVIGSGFGGTILALSLANYVQDKNGRVCMLERGQWWVSHEMPDGQEGRLQGSTPTIREYLDSKNMPYYHTWAYPDNLDGAFQVFASTRKMNRQGLYDFRNLGNVHVIAASGVGGGSLVYSNVTEKPPSSVYANWPTEKSDVSIEPFFKLAENFIGVNTITTTAGIGSFLLKRSQVFQEAAKAIKTKNKGDSNKAQVINENDDFDAKLSITDITVDYFRGTDGPLSKTGPLSPENIDKITSLDELKTLVKNETGPIEKKYPKEANVCQRQGRCVVGCIPGARHTLNKQIITAMMGNKPLDVQPLCEVFNIEEINEGDFKYKIDFYDLSLIHDKELTDTIKNNIIRTIKTKTVILAAGSLGSTEILLKCRNLDLNRETLGSKFTTNGDLLGVVTPTEKIVDASRGPVVTSIAKFSNPGQSFSFSIEDSGIPKMFAELFAYLFGIMSKEKDEYIPKTGLPELLQREFIKDILNNRNVVNGLMNLINVPNSPFNPSVKSMISSMQSILNSFNSSKASSPEESVSNILLLSGMGIDDSNAHLDLDENDSIKLTKPYDLNQKVFSDIINVMQQFAEETGKDGKNSLLVPMWDSKPDGRSQFVLHPLGGCPMGVDASEGVVDHLGRPFKGKNGSVFENFYIVDGSIMPGSLGVNPSLMISALAFRIAAIITKDNINNPKFLPL
jgi:choline dehydrogenase-like flavoprotein